MAGRPPAGIPAIEGRSDGAGAGAGIATGALTRGAIGAIGMGGAGAGSGCRTGAGTAAAGGCAPLLETGKTAAHTLQRADTPAAGTLAGSTR